MDPTCGGCDERHHDFGGCRCQAFLVTGDAAATDPVCPKSAHRGRIDDMLDAAAVNRMDGVPARPLRFVPGASRSAGLVFRSDENSRACSAPGADPC
jgi:pyrroloquinoline quinone biosynthesis protein E